MSDEKSQQQTSTESTVAGAAKTGKAISNIAKGAAAGGAHGAAIEAGKSSAKWLIPLVAAVLLPLILVAMLPSIIFGSLLGDGTDTPNGISSDEVLVQNMTAINESISSILSEGLTDPRRAEAHDRVRRWHFFRYSVSGPQHDQDGGSRLQEQLLHCHCNQELHWARSKRFFLHR